MQGHLGEELLVLGVLLVRHRVQVGWVHTLSVVTDVVELTFWIYRSYQCGVRDPMSLGHLPVGVELSVTLAVDRGLPLPASCF